MQRNILSEIECLIAHLIETLKIAKTSTQKALFPHKQYRGLEP